MGHHDLDQRPRPLHCPVCGALVFFDSSSCLRCGTELAYDVHSGRFGPAAGAPGTCGNRDVIGCNWAPDGEPGDLCLCCVLTRTRPADSDTAGLAAWAEAESAKRLLVAQLVALDLTPRARDDAGGLAFDLLSSATEPVTTGHADGVITIDLAEGADPHREAVRVSLDEPYRTMLGHLRHETGHYYWPLLAEPDPRFTDLFGDASADYAEALAEHYAREDDGAWRGTHISRYAAAHPWEDWAETFAHYLHIHEVLRTAATWQLRIAAADGRADPAAAIVARPRDFDAVIGTWMPLAIALNEINRGMGHRDLYPYALSEPVTAKLRFVHEVIHRTAGS